MIESLFVFFGFLVIGESISIIFSLPIPGSVIGMVLLTVALRYELVNIKNLTPGAEVLLKNMSFLFVPPGVGLIVYMDVISSELVPILVSYVISTLLVLYVSGMVIERLEK